jgi:hypothetical protein
VTLTLDQPADADTARQYLISYSARVRKLGRLPIAQLGDLADALLGQQIHGRNSRSELVSQIIAAEYPDFAAAGHILAASVTA